MRAACSCCWCCRTFLHACAAKHNDVFCAASSEPPGSEGTQSACAAADGPPSIAAAAADAAVCHHHFAHMAGSRQLAQGRCCRAQRVGQRWQSGDVTCTEERKQLRNIDDVACNSWASRCGMHAFALTACQPGSDAGHALANDGRGEEVNSYCVEPHVWPLLQSQGGSATRLWSANETERWQVRCMYVCMRQHVAQLLAPNAAAPVSAPAPRVWQPRYRACRPPQTCLPA